MWDFRNQSRNRENCFYPGKPLGIPSITTIAFNLVLSLFDSNSSRVGCNVFSWQDWTYESEKFSCNVVLIIAVMVRRLIKVYLECLLALKAMNLWFLFRSNNFKKKERKCKALSKGATQLCNPSIFWFLQWWFLLLGMMTIFWRPLNYCRTV